jgi:hypothetical protein
MVSGDGTGRACHYTFLEPDGSSKLKTRRAAIVDPDSGKAHSAKLMYPASGGLTIPVTYGRAG